MFALAHKTQAQETQAQQTQGQSLLQSVLGWCLSWFKRKPESGFGCCAEAEIERMAKDLRMTASELRVMASKGPRAADLLAQRMAALDLDLKEVARLEPAALHDLQRVCTMCKAHRRCAWDFAHHAPPPTWERYCPNTSTLAALNGMPWPTRREW